MVAGKSDDRWNCRNSSSGKVRRFHSSTSSSINFRYGRTGTSRIYLKRSTQKSDTPSPSPARPSWPRSPPGQVEGASCQQRKTIVGGRSLALLPSVPSSSTSRYRRLMISALRHQNVLDRGFQFDCVDGRTGASCILRGVPEVPRIRYAMSGDVHIAYQVVGRVQLISSTRLGSGQTWKSCGNGPIARGT